MEIGKTMRDIRVKAGMTQSELRKGLNVAQPSLSRIENGRTTPKWNTIARFCEVSGVSLAELLLRSLRPEDMPPGDADKADLTDIVNLAIRLIERSRG